MKVKISYLLFFTFFLSWPISSDGHIGDQIFPIPELTDSDLKVISVRDGHVRDWDEIMGPPLFRAEDFFFHSDIGEGASFDPDDLDYRIWLGWHNGTQRLYFAIERTDDIYINEYEGGDTNQFWRYDTVEFLVDGDHSGGDFFMAPCADTWSNCDEKRHRNKTAQQFMASAHDPDGRFVGYAGEGDWATSLPYAYGGGGIGKTPMDVVIEFFVTPFDDLIYSAPDSSLVSSLSPNKIIGFDIAVPDFDDKAGNYRAYHSLSGRLDHWRFADLFVDGFLVNAFDRSTFVENLSWARIKASFK